MQRTRRRKLAPKPVKKFPLKWRHQVCRGPVCYWLVGQVFNMLIFLDSVKDVSIFVLWLTTWIDHDHRALFMEFPVHLKLKPFQLLWTEMFSTRNPIEHTFHSLLRTKYRFIKKNLKPGIWKFRLLKKVERGFAAAGSFRAEISTILYLLASLLKVIVINASRPAMSTLRNAIDFGCGFGMRRPRRCWRPTIRVGEREAAKNGSDKTRRKSDVITRRPILCAVEMADTQRCFIRLFGPVSSQ